MLKKILLNGLTKCVSFGQCCLWYCQKQTKELGQYPAILTSGMQVNNTDIPQTVAFKINMRLKIAQLYKI